MKDFAKLSAHHTSEAAARLAKKRNAAQTRLKIYGMAAIAFSALALFSLLWTVVGNASGAVKEHYVSIPITLDEGKIDRENILRSNFASLTKSAIRDYFPSVKDRKIRRQLNDIVSVGAPFELGEKVAQNPELIGQTIDYDFLASDVSDLYLKGEYGQLETIQSTAPLSLEIGAKGAVTFETSPEMFASLTEAIQQELLRRASRADQRALQEQNGVSVFKARLAEAETDEDKAEFQAQFEARQAKLDEAVNEAKTLRQTAEQATYFGDLDKFMPSAMLLIDEGWIKITEISKTGGSGRVLLPVSDAESLTTNQWALIVNDKPEVARKVSDDHVAWLESLRAQDRISETFNWRFFTSGDSREPELAGIFGALVGSMFTMFVTFLLAFPVGVLSAIYLEEFAPKNRVTDFVEVSINNLAAVPSIVFGLLGLSVFLGVFGVPRSAPLAGGIVLALMSLPTIIIASRAAIRAVPPSIRDAALGLGASKLQTSFHHVLPLAMPGVLTGSIIAMAQALGETAPLIMIGMVAFIVDIPEGIFDASSVLPVQVFRWADFPERAFESRTAAAIVVLLVFLVLMNAIAILLRKRFERRW